MKTNVILRLVTVVIIAVALFLLPQVWGWSGLPLVIITALFIMTFFIVRWHAHHTGYQCPECSHTFVISPTTDFLSPHLSGVKMLRCPQCGHSSWCLEIEHRSVTEALPSSSAPQIISDRGGTTLLIQVAFVLIIYCGLWAYTLYLWPSLPTDSGWWIALRIPIVTIILPVLQVTFCLFAFRRGYRSRIYLFVSLFVIVFLLLAIWMQRTILSRI